MAGGEASMSFDQVMRMSLNDFECGRCRAAVGSPCRSAKGDEVSAPHKARVDAYWKVAAEAAEAEVQD